MAGVYLGPVYTPLQPASRSADNMENWTLGAVPLHGRASQPAEMGPTYGQSFICHPGKAIVTCGILSELFKV